MNTSNVLPTFTDSKGICEMFGISEPTLIRAKQRGDIPYVVINGVHRFNVDKVIQALEEKAKKKGGRV